MTVDEIRMLVKAYEDNQYGPEVFQTRALLEIAAQLAELNENLIGLNNACRSYDGRLMVSMKGWQE